MNFASKLLIFSGISLLIFGGFLIFQRYNPKKLAFNNFESQAISSLSIVPVRIAIPSLDINIPVVGAEIIDGKWEATTEGASYLESSPVPGSVGNSIMYGHNWSSLLGALPKIKTGEKIEILLSNGDKKEFTVKFTATVNPDQTHVLSQTDDARITLYTCAGFLDSKRFVATAVLAP